MKNSYMTLVSSVFRMFLFLVSVMKIRALEIFIVSKSNISKLGYISKAIFGQGIHGSRSICNSDEISTDVQSSV